MLQHAATHCNIGGDWRRRGRIRYSNESKGTVAAGETEGWRERERERERERCNPKEDESAGV